MKQTSLLFACVLGILLSSSGCRYDDGPILSFQSPETRLVNSWIVVAATDENGADNTDEYDGQIFTFTDAGTATVLTPVLGVNVTLEGDWNFLDDKEVLQLILSDPTGLITLREEYYIERLTRNALWLEDPDDDDRTIRMEPQL